MTRDTIGFEKLVILVDAFSVKRMHAIEVGGWKDRAPASLASGAFFPQGQAPPLLVISTEIECDVIISL